MHAVGADSFAKILALAWLRLKLLLRQKLGWISILVGVGLVVISLLVANVSFVNAMKIFWDFSLSVIFVLQLTLALYLGSQLYSDEKNRRTLHLLLTSGLSRSQWIVGNVLGIFLALLAMQALWYGVVLATSYLVFSDAYVFISLQAMALQSVEVFLLIFFALFSSLFLRPVLSLISVVIVTFFLHSLTSLQNIFTDPQVGRFVDDRGSSFVLIAARFLPPLEWLDLKPLVGYQESLSWLTFSGIAASGILWASLFGVLAWLRFERMDL
jgi:ABC-2 type transport system permease protein